jgi:hypothetical protein
MNLDDLLCVGATDNILLSSTIGAYVYLFPFLFFSSPPFFVGVYYWCVCVSFDVYSYLVSL